MATNILTELKNFMNYSSTRQVIISQNIANAHTPKYIAKDVDFKSTLDESFAKGMKVTSPKHMINTAAGGHNVFENTGGEYSPSGNNVEIQNEMLKLSENRMEYQAATNLYKKMMAMLKRAASNG